MLSHTHHPPTDLFVADSDAEDGWDSENDGPAAPDRRRNANGGGGGSKHRPSSEAEIMVRERGEDGSSVVDLLDSSMVRNMRISKGNGRGRKKDFDGFFGSDGDSSDDSDGDDGPELALRDGKFVIPGGSDDNSDDDSDDYARRGDGSGGGGGRRKKRSRDNGVDSDGDDGYVVDTGKDESGFAHVAGRRARAAAREANAASSKGAQGRSVPGARGGGASGRDADGGGRASAAGKRQKIAMVRGTATGAEFRSKKAGGDVKRKGATLEPYAYIPLDGRTLTGKKAGSTALKQYGAVVGTVRGVKRGYQQRRGRQQKK